VRAWTARTELAVSHLVVVAVEVETAIEQQPAYDDQRLLEAFEAMLPGQATCA
jgi:hypothetical protein